MTTSLLVKCNKSHSAAWLLSFKIYKADISSLVPSPFNFHGTFWKAVHCRHHIAGTWPRLTHTERSHAVIQTFTLLSGAKCTTIANLYTLRWSWPDFKHSLPTAVHVGEERCPIKQQCLPAESPRLPPTEPWKTATPMWLKLSLVSIHKLIYTHLRLLVTFSFKLCFVRHKGYSAALTESVYSAAKNSQILVDISEFRNDHVDTKHTETV